MCMLTAFDASRSRGSIQRSSRTLQIPLIHAFGLRLIGCRRKRASKVIHLELSDVRPNLINCEIEGAALPLAILTAVVGLYSSIKLDLPQPWSPATKPKPLLIYGASSAVGYYVLQLALKSNLHPLICIAGRASAHVEKLLDKSKGDSIVVRFVGLNIH
jgi:hypothetical protein